MKLTGALQKVIKEDNMLRIENILPKKKRGRDTFLLVKWKGHPEKFNSWVNEKDITDLQKNIKFAIANFLATKWTKPKHFI